MTKVRGHIIQLNVRGSIVQGGYVFAFAPAEAPTLLTAATVSDTQIDLSWTINSNRHIGHVIERTSVPGGLTGWSQIDTVLGATAVYSDITCEPGTLYYYRVRAYRYGIYSDYSNVANATTDDWVAYWATLISATVENAAPTDVVLTFPTAQTSLVATDITATINGANDPVVSASWLGGVWTVVLTSTVTYGDVVIMTFVKTGGTKAVTNNVLPSWFTAGAVNNVLMVGDSFMRGYAATNELTLSFQALLRSALKTELGDAGSGTSWARYMDATYSYNWLQWSGDFSGTSNVKAGMIGYCATGVTTGKYWEVTKDGLYFDLVHSVASYHVTFDIYLDDVFYASIARTRYTGGAGMYYVERITAASYGSHKIKVVVTTPYYAQIIQLNCYNGNNGVNQILCGASGATTLWYVLAAAPDAFTYQCEINQPKLTIIELGYNDYVGQVALNDYETRITSMVNAALTYGDVYLVNNTDYNPGKAIPIVDYNTRLANIATATGAKVIDMATVFGNAANALSNGWIVSAANWHPTDAGHQKFYDTIYAAIMTG